MDKGVGRSLRDGLSPTVEPVPVSPADAASIPSAVKEAASRLLNPMFVALERMSNRELGLAMEAFHRSGETNCWWAIYAFKWQMPGIIAQEASNRGLEPEDWVFAASAIETRSAETTGSVGEADESAVAKPDAQGDQP